MIVDVLLGAAVMLNAWLLSSRTTPLFPINRKRKAKHKDNVSNL